MRRDASPRLRHSMSKSSLITRAIILWPLVPFIGSLHCSWQTTALDLMRYFWMASASVIIDRAFLALQFSFPFTFRSMTREPPVLHLPLLSKRDEAILATLTVFDGNSHNRWSSAGASDVECSQLGSTEPLFGSPRVDSTHHNFAALEDLPSSHAHSQPPS